MNHPAHILLVDDEVSIQRTMVPSAIDSPIWGITTGVDIRT